MTIQEIKRLESMFIVEMHAAERILRRHQQERDAQHDETPES